MKKFKLLSDQPLRVEGDFESAKFGHKEIAETLTSLITNCPTPFTIGLFGRWGSGKSTISYMLKKAMSTSKCGFVLFDVWKHESDALRRTFLKESVNQLKEQKNLKNSFNLDERIESKITHKIEEQHSIMEVIKKYWKVGLGCILVVVLLGLLIYKLLGAEYWKSYLSIVLSILAGGGLASSLMAKALSNLLKSATIIREIDRFEDPHEFEKEFGRVLSNLNINRMLVVFDNLDRVAHEKAVEILATIKTFLETENIKDKGVVFLIPCDDKAIKEHIRNVYHRSSEAESDAANDEEFLRKFFNATLRIPEFYPAELESYAKDLLYHTEIPDLKEGTVAWLVTKAYRQSPRQIKQFINQLISMYILVLKRIDEKSLPKEFLEGNISKLTKFLILYNKFPNEMENLRRDKRWDLEKVTHDIATARAAGQPEFNKFLTETSHIPINNLNIFFMLRRSDFEVQLPGYDDLAAALKDNLINDVTSYLKSMSEFSKKKEVLGQAIKELVEGTSSPDTKISIINSCLTGLSRINQRLEEEVYVELANALLELKSYLYVIEPKVVFQQILSPHPKSREDFVQSYVDLLAEADEKKKPPIIFVEALFLEITQNEKWFEKYREKLIEIVIASYHDQLKIVRQFLVNEQIQKSFKVGKIIYKTISTLSSTDYEVGTTLFEKIGLFVDAIPDVLDSEVADLTMVKLTEAFAFENGQPLEGARIELKKKLAECVSEVLNKHTATFNEKTNQSSRDKFSQVIIQGINQIGELNQKSIFIELVIALSRLATSYSDKAAGIVKKFITSAPVDVFFDAFKDEKQWNILLSDVKYSEDFRQRSLKDQKIFDQLYNFLTEVQKEEWLLVLLDLDPMRGVQKIQLLDLKIPNDEPVVHKLLSIAKGVDISARFKLYELCDRLKFANSDALSQQACEDAKSYLTTLDQPIQVVGYNLSTGIASFKEEHKRDIARTVIEFLVSLPVNQLFQPHSIRAVLQLLPTLGEQSIDREHFIQCIFRLLLDSTNPEALTLGIEVLSKTTPKYTDFQKYYDDLKHRVETEKNEPLKEILLGGFRELKKSSAVEEPLWHWLDFDGEKAP